MPSETAVARSLLIVEDDDVLRPRLARAFRERGFEVREAPDVDTALEAARSDPPEYALVDLRLGTRSGLEVVRGLADLDAATAIVVLTGYGSIATALEAVRLGATHYLTKPADVDDLLAAFARGTAGTATASDATHPGESAAGADSTPTLARVEWEHINRVLSDCGGNVSQAARILGIHRRSLQRKLAKYPTAR
jgi:two-component system, response regulator RegA